MSISDKQMATLRHIHRFRITTQAALQRMLFTKSPGAVRNHLQRLRDRCLVEGSDLGAKRYYALTRRALRLLDQRPDSYSPLGADAILERFGVLEFCARAPKERSKYLPKEFFLQFPELSAKNVSAQNYYLDMTGGERRLGWIHVHRTADPRRDRDRLVHKVLERRARHPRWKEVLDDRVFALGIVVPSERRADDLRELLAEDWPEVTTRFEVVEELLFLQERRSDPKEASRGAE